MIILLKKGAHAMNKEIQLLAAGKGIRQWQIAKELGIAEETLCRWLRCKLLPERKALIISTINKLVAKISA